MSGIDQDVYSHGLNSVVKWIWGCLLDMGAEWCFISYNIYQKYFGYKKLKFSNLVVHSPQELVCINKGVVDLDVEVLSVKTCRQFHVLECLNAHCVVGVDYMQNRGISFDFFLKKTLVVNRDENYRKV